VDGHFSTNISQGSVATHLRGGGIFYHRFTTNVLLSLMVKYSGTFFPAYTVYCVFIF